MAGKVHWAVVGAHGPSLYLFRGELIKRLQRLHPQGFCASDICSDEERQRIEALGVDFEEYPVARSGLSPSADLKTMHALRRLYAERHVTHVLAYTIKPVIWTGVALMFNRHVRFTALITGLGYAFEPGGFQRALLKTVARNLYRISLRRANLVVFQNVDNRNLFVSMGIVKADKCHVVSGSGVDVSRYEKAPLPNGQRVQFLLIARLLGDKGIREYAAAAHYLRERGVQADCVLLGPVDPSPDGISMAEVQSWVDEQRLTYKGETRDVRPAISRCDIYVLPSYHEGMPRTVLEAMSMGRPILTTDVPGCRETVVNDVNGWLVPKGDAMALAERMQWFVDNRQVWQRMAQASRELAERTFDVRKVNEEMIRIMGLAPNGGVTA